MLWWFKIDTRTTTNCYIQKTCNTFGKTPGGRGHSVIWPRRICAVVLGTVFRVLNLKQGLQFHPTASLRGCVFESKAFKRVLKMLQISGSTFVAPTIIPKNLVPWNYLILYAKRNESGSQNRISCLKQGSEMSNFCLQQGQVLKALVAHLYTNFPWVAPPRTVIQKVLAFDRL